MEKLKNSKWRLKRLKNHQKSGGNKHLRVHQEGKCGRIALEN